MHDEPQ
jgi:hypothetical protein